MTALSHFRPQYVMLGLCVIVAMISLGCREAEKIRSYSAPKEPKVEVAAAAPVNSGEPTDRMLAAILPSGDKAWFFKVVGPIAAVDMREKEINDFFAGIRPADGSQPKWEVPAGWKEGAGNAMRAATLLIPGDEKPLELTVTALPWAGGSDALLMNVNRWRGQLQLPDAGPQQLGEFTREIKAGDAPMTIVDLRGRFKSGGMTPPFAGGAGAASRAAPGAPSNLPPGHPPLDPNASADTPDSKAGLPPGHPPIDAAPGGPPQAGDVPAAAGVPRFEVPAGWTQLPAGGMRKAAFAIGDEKNGAIVTLIDFPAKAGPMIADPLPNVNRWRREVGLPEIEKDKLGDSTEQIEIGGQPATYIHLVPDPSQAEQSKLDRATIAAMVTSGDQIWFIKLTGARDVVAAQQEAFKKFLKSVRFAADGGAPDGNK